MSMYVGEALAGEGNEVAHIDLLIGDKEGPVGAAFASAWRGRATVTPISWRCWRPIWPSSPRR